MTPRIQPAEIVEIRELGPDVREIVLQPTERPVSFKAGQWVSVHLPLSAEKPVVRAYTLAEPACEKGRMVLCFDRVKGGAASTYLFAAQRGDCLPVSDPLGAFVLPALDGRGVAMITWLTGVVPMRCMLLEMLRSKTGPPPRTLLMCGAPSADALPYHAWLQALAAEQPWFTFVPVLPPVGASMEEGISHLLEALPAAVAAAFPEGADASRVHPMLAGLKALVLPAREWFVQHLGFTPAQVQKETYD